MRPAFFCAGAFGLAAAQPVFADAVQNLIMAADAARTVNYQGVAVYRGDNDFEVLKVEHRFQTGSERERIITLTGEPRQLLRTDDRVIWILPKGQMVMRDRPSLKGVLSQLTAERVSKLAEWYSFSEEPADRIADRATMGVMVSPKDDYRYGYEICYDQKNHVPLKISLIGEHGQVLEQLMFTEVTYPKSIPDSDFETEIDPSKYNLVAHDLPPLSPVQSTISDGGTPQVVFSQLPPGFRIVSREHRPLPNGQRGETEHLLLSDGLSSVSVFSAIRQPSPEKTFSGISHVGSVQAYGRMVGDYHITIVGEVPSSTVRMIGDGVSPVLIPPDLSVMPQLLEPSESH